jgi:hypothetical protein
VRGRVDPEVAAGDFRPNAKRNFLLIVQLALGFSVTFSTGCMSTVSRDVTADRPPRQDVRIMRLVTASGSTVVFSRADPGRVEGDRIIGMAVAGFEERVPAPFLSVKKHPDGRVHEIVDRNGQVHPVYRVLREGETEWIVVTSGPGSRQVAIPLAQVKQISFRRTNVAGTFVFVPAAVVLGLTGLIYLLFGSGAWH